MMVLFQPSAYLTCLNPDHWVVSSGVAYRALEKFCSYRTLFQGFVVAVQCVLDHVRQKLLASIAGAKEGTAQDGLQLPKDGPPPETIGGSAAAIDPWAPVGYGGRLHRPRYSPGTGG